MDVRQVPAASVGVASWSRSRGGRVVLGYTEWQATETGSVLLWSRHVRQVTESRGSASLEESELRHCIGTVARNEMAER